MRVKMVCCNVRKTLKSWEIPDLESIGKIQKGNQTRVRNRKPRMVCW